MAEKKTEKKKVKYIRSSDMGDPPVKDKSDNAISTRNNIPYGPQDQKNIDRSLKDKTDTALSTRNLPKGAKK